MKHSIMRKSEKIWFSDIRQPPEGVLPQLWTVNASHSDDLPKPKTTELLQKGVESVQEYSATEEREESRRWRVFRIGEQEHRVDMKAIEPYKRVISHGGNRHSSMPNLTLNLIQTLKQRLRKPCNNVRIGHSVGLKPRFAPTQSVIDVTSLWGGLTEVGQSVCLQNINEWS